MSRFFRSRTAVAVATAVVITSAFGATQVLASHDTTTIHACKDRQGNVRIVDAAADCTKQESAVSWNVQGPAGPQGLQGDIGPAGPQGPSGIVTSVSTTGPGMPPSSQLDFIAPTVTVSATANQVVHISSQRALGSTAPGGASDLRLNVCRQSTTSGAPISVFGSSMVGLAVPQHVRLPFALTGRFVVPVTGEYRVGLCGQILSNGDPAKWNSNDYGRTEAIVANG